METVKQKLLNRYGNGLSISDRKDLSQEIDIALWKAEKRFNKDINPNKEAFLWICGKLAAMSYLKKENRYHNKVLPVDEIEDTTKELYDLPHYDFLTDKENLYIPYILKDISAKELGNMLNISEKTVWNNVIAIKEKIKDNLKEN